MQQALRNITTAPLECWETMGMERRLKIHSRLCLLWSRGVMMSRWLHESCWSLKDRVALRVLSNLGFKHFVGPINFSKSLFQVLMSHDRLNKLRYCCRQQSHDQNTKIPKFQRFLGHETFLSCPSCPSWWYLQLWNWLRDCDLTCRAMKSKIYARVYGGGAQ